MSCRACTSDHQRSFPSEINIHFPGLQNATKSTVWAFPSLLVCLQCGFTECSLTEREMKELDSADSSHTVENRDRTLKYLEDKVE